MSILEATLEKPDSDVENNVKKFIPKIKWDKIEKENAIDLTKKYADEIEEIDSTKDEIIQKEIRNKIIKDIKKNCIHNGELISFLIPKKDCIA